MKKKKKKTLFRQLIIRLTPPVIVILSIISFINYTYNKEMHLEHYNGEKKLIINTLKTLLLFRDVALEIEESSLDKRMKRLSHTLVHDYFKDTKNIDKVDLDKIRTELDFDMELEDIYIINEDGIVINTSFKKDLNLNLAHFGEKYIQFFKNLLRSNRFNRDRHAHEGATDKIRIYSYQPTLDGKFIVELGFYSNKVNQIDDEFQRKIREMANSFENITDIKLFIASQEMYAFGGREKPKKSHHKTFMQTFEKKSHTMIAENENGEDIFYDYFYLEMQNASLYAGYVAQIVSTQDSLNNALKDEIVRQLTIYILGILIIIFLVFQVARKLLIPIRRLLEKVKSISEDNLSERVVVAGTTEIAELSENFNLMIQKLEKSYAGLEKKVQERTLALSLQAKKLQEATKLKEVFVANTSHEIRTPLNGIVGYTNLLLNTKLNEKQFTYLKNIKVAGNNLSVVINDILDFSKIEAGKLILEEINFDFRDAIDNFFNTILIKALEKGINLKRKIDKQIPQTVNGDPVRLYQILSNLVGNAIKFTPSGGSVDIEVQLVRETESGIILKFMIIDTGIGIENDKLDIIFDSFTQASSETTRKFGGTGLGLSIVYNLVKLHRGSISVSSELGEGSNFKFTLNYKKATGVATKQTKESYRINKAKKIRKICILLVEDYPLNQSLVIDTIKEYNSKIHIDLAENGLQAIEKVQKNDYQLIIMDIQMPEMDGYEATKYIRTKIDSPKNSIPILGMSAHAMMEEQERCMQLGMNDYLVKPFNPEDLFHKIERLTENTKKDKTTSDKTAKTDAPKENTKITLQEIKQNKAELQYINLLYLPKVYQKSEEKMQKILKMSYKNINHDMENLSKYCNEKNWKRVKDISHALKNSMYYIGLVDLHEILKKIEKEAMKNNESETISSKINTVEQVWSKAKIELQSLIT